MEPREKAKLRLDELKQLEKKRELTKEESDRLYKLLTYFNEPNF